MSLLRYSVESGRYPSGSVQHGQVNFVIVAVYGYTTRNYVSNSVFEFGQFQPSKSDRDCVRFSETSMYRIWLIQSRTRSILFADKGAS